MQWILALALTFSAFNTFATPSVLQSEIDMNSAANLSKPGLCQRWLYPHNDGHLPSFLRRRMRRSELLWNTQRSNGPLFITEDLAKISRSMGGQQAYLWGEDISEIDLNNYKNFVGKWVEITPYQITLPYYRPKQAGKSYQGYLVKAALLQGFVRFTLQDFKGRVFEIPLAQNLKDVPYEDFFHGHTVREIFYEAYDPTQDYLHQIVYARLYSGAGGPTFDRFAGQTIVGEVIEQSSSGVKIFARGQIYNFSVPQYGYLQVGFFH